MRAIGRFGWDALHRMTVYLDRISRVFGSHQLHLRSHHPYFFIGSSRLPDRIRSIFVSQTSSAYHKTRLATTAVRSSPTVHSSSRKTDYDKSSSNNNGNNKKQQGPDGHKNISCQKWGEPKLFSHWFLFGRYRAL